ncbi:MAG: NADH-quinone oxidoreductase subunit L, partial [Streptomycetales bacterium]
HEAPPAMRWPLVTLTVPTVLLGLAGLRGSWLPAWLGAGPGAGAAFLPTFGTAAVSTFLAIVGVFAAALVWYADPALDPARALGVLRGPCERAFSVDAAYAALVVRPALAIARLVRFTDHEVVDAYVRGSGVAARLLGAGLRYSQNGNVQVYLTGLLSGVVVIAAAVLWSVGR